MVVKAKIKRNNPPIIDAGTAIFIDFDNTIFDTVSFHHDFLKILLSNGIEEDYIKKFYKDNGLNPVNLVNNLNNEKINKEVDALFKKAKNYLYKDAISFLKNKGNRQYILYSYGYLDYQNKKIDNALIKDYFDEVIITDTEKTKLDLDYQKGNQILKLFLERYQVVFLLRNLVIIHQILHIHLHHRI